MTFAPSLLDEGFLLSGGTDKGLDKHLTEFTSPSIFCKERNIPLETYKDVLVTALNVVLPIPVVFRTEPTIVAHLIQVERENTACEHRKYKRGKRKTKEGLSHMSGSTLTFIFAFRNAVYPHPTSLTTDMLHEYLKTLGESKNKAKMRKLLKFEIAVTGNMPTSRGFRDLNIHVKTASNEVFVPFDAIFTPEACQFQKIPIGFVRHVSSLRDKKIKDLFVARPVYMGTHTRYRRGINKKLAQHHRQVQTALALMSFPRRERLALFFGAAPVARFYRRDMDDETMDACLQTMVELMGETTDHRALYYAYTKDDVCDWPAIQEDAARQQLAKDITDNPVATKEKLDMFRVIVNEHGISIVRL